MRRLLVVGGGSAGWMATAYLNSILNDQGRRPKVAITLIESPDIPRISVGEATIPSMRHILGATGVDEVEFMKATKATFKQSIRYQNWVQQDGGYYHHPFSRMVDGPLDRAGQDWLASDRSLPFMSTVSAQAALCDLGLSPRTLDRWDLGAPFTYAYHMNAQAFADYLTKFAVDRGVRHVRDNMTEVLQHEDGRIRAIRTEGGLELEADLFIDCTGFRATLVGETLKTPYEDCSQFLMCDHAVTTHIPYDEYFPGMVRPYTTATALSSGWIWDIPMQDRRSIGYVHSSAFISPEDAERELRAYEGPHAENLPTRRIRFHVGRRQKSWVKNCIAIGLSGGFIEPLESTGLYLCDLAAVMLAEHFPWTDDAVDLMAFRFNRILSNRFYEILDFINMHYCLTRRTDTAFWREVQKPERITDRLKAKFKYWAVKPPSASDFQDQFFPGLSPQPGAAAGFTDSRPNVDTAGLWGYQSYEFIMYGMQNCGRPLPPPAPDAPPTRVPDALQERMAMARRRLPPHHVWLQRALGMGQFRDAGYHPPGWMTGATRPI